VVSIVDCLLGRVAANTTDSASLRNRFAQLVAYEPRTRGTIEDYMRAADAAGYGPARLSLFSFHRMGAARTGGSANDSACDPEGQVWGVRNAVVCDASTFPTASGVNPTVTIEAIAHMNASALAERLS
jgi:long-chain-alcohol oxidase